MNSLELTRILSIFQVLLFAVGATRGEGRAEYVLGLGKLPESKSIEARGSIDLGQKIASVTSITKSCGCIKEVVAELRESDHGQAVDFRLQLNTVDKKGIDQQLVVRCKDQQGVEVLLPVRIKADVESLFSITRLDSGTDFILGKPAKMVFRIAKDPKASLLIEGRGDISQKMEINDQNPGELIVYIPIPTDDVGTRLGQLVVKQGEVFKAIPLFWTIRDPRVPIGAMPLGIVSVSERRVLRIPLQEELGREVKDVTFKEEPLNLLNYKLTKVNDQSVLEVIFIAARAGIIRDTILIHFGDTIKPISVQIKAFALANKTP